MASKLPLVISGGVVRELADADVLYDQQLYTPKRTMTLSHSNGGLGGSVATTLSAGTAGSYRFVVKLPCNVDQWRIGLRNQEYSAGAKNSATLKKLIVGKHARSTSGTWGETGDFVGGTATTIVSTDQTIPGSSGTGYYFSPWVSVANGFSADDLFTADTEFLVGVGYTFGSLTSLQTGAGRAWWWSNSTSGTTPGTAGSGATQTYIPFDWKIEYTTTTRRKVCVVVGDSISEGIAGGNSSLSSTSLWRNAVEQWAARTGRIIVNLSLAGVGYVHFATSPATNYLWTRRDITAHPVDEVLLSAGSNDWSQASRTLANMQADVTTIVNYIQSTLGLSPKFYMATNLARGATGDAVRLTFNEWISSYPTFCSEVIDWDGATRGTSAQNLVDQYTPDSIHPSWLGNIAMRDVLLAALPD
ncbi:SGNH/GDSL hydrolase family protein [Nocardia sp. CDC159]|uniref:SGNH/GDSL hydrolase family protein n=1 Tax=Nocardia pulmonis TaxID=2951408 RepID=A0A9X2EFC4_9NOCA|nr:MULTISPECIES: SGNH/GDSL hydrolase family protein [Nocardia]MCM6777933.1 SGNH/GDSL hydrolase family protein [Nocardia pulmonis]MCM6790896.1 SGNH/GDSL hydrolase family protein [Nocardia sp. CDC159]